MFDTLLHRTVHPNYTRKLWGKYLIRELGIPTDTDTLFAVRAAALLHLSKERGLRAVEVDYDQVVIEIYRRLVNSDLLVKVSFEKFLKVFYQADLVAETSVQFKNETLIADLYYLKEKGYRIFLVTDFYLSRKVIVRILDFHGMASLFEEVFVSCSLGKCKENGSIYPEVLHRTAVDPDTAMMMGDNKKSDVLEAEKKGIQTIHLKHASHKIRNKKNLFGDDARRFNKVCEHLENKYRRSAYPYSEYLLHFYFFTERLYIKAKKDRVKNIFFLAREGFYLQRLFEAYQKMNRFTDSDEIGTHYLKMSRHSALQIALRPLPEEDFSAFKGSLGKMSAYHFLEGMGFSEEIQKEIFDQLGEVPRESDVDFFRSDTMLRLRENTRFTAEYERHRKTQKSAFEAYLDSFGVDFKQEGVHLVDVGWGGTMQENLYRFLGEEIPVTGYYLGLKEVYDIQPDTKRYGLNFSIYPGRRYSDEVLMANCQLYEQLLGAPHGSTVRYTGANGDSYAITHHEENEKQAYENWIRPVQEYMFDQFEGLFESLRPIDYNQVSAQKYLTEMALRTGIFGKKRDIKFVDRLSKGFYQNVGDNQVGVAYSPSQIKGSKLGLLASFIKSPERQFRYLVKVKPYLYAKGLYGLSWPLNLSYYYIKFNFWFKKKFLKKGLLS